MLGNENPFDTVREYVEHILVEPVRKNKVKAIEAYDVIEVEPLIGHKYNTRVRYLDNDTHKEHTVTYDRVNINEFIKSKSVKEQLTENNEQLVVLHPTKTVMDLQVLRDLGLKHLTDSDINIVRHPLNSKTYPLFKNCFKSGIKVIGEQGRIVTNSGQEANGFEIIEELDGGNTVKLDIPVNDARGIFVSGDLLYGVKGPLVGLSHNLFYIDKKRDGTSVIFVASKKIMTCKSDGPKSIKVSMSWVDDGLSITVKHVREEVTVIPLSRPTTPIPFRTQVYSLSDNLSAIAIGYQFDRVTQTIKTNLKDLTLTKQHVDKVVNDGLNRDIFYVDLSGKELSSIHVKNRRDLKWVKREFVVCEKKDVHLTINNMLNGHHDEDNILYVNQTKGLGNVTVRRNNVRKVYNNYISGYYVTFDLLNKRGSFTFKPKYIPLYETMEELPIKNHFEFEINSEYEEPVLLVIETTKPQHNVPTYSYTELLAETVPVLLERKVTEQFTLHASDQNQYIFGNLNDKVVVKNNITYNVNIDGDKIVPIDDVQNTLHTHYGFQIPVMTGSRVMVENCFSDNEDVLSMFGVSTQPEDNVNVGSDDNKLFAVSKARDKFLFDSPYRKIENTERYTKEAPKFDSISFDVLADAVIIKLYKDGEMVYELLIQLLPKTPMIYISNIVVPNKESVENLFNDYKLTIS